MPRLSIVIPAKNEEKILPKLLASIRAQTFRDYEVIVADAHSTDGTVKLAKEFGARIVEGGMPGPGRNRGALKAKGEIVLFLDADAELTSVKFLKDCLTEMDRRRLDVATCVVKPLSDNRVDHALHGIYNIYTALFEQLNPHAVGSCMFARRSLHQYLNGFDEEVVFAEDHDYAQRAKKEGFRLGILRAHPIAVSVRRLEKDGRLNIFLRYLYTEMRIIAKRPIKGTLPFTYEMGGEAPNTKGRRRAKKKTYTSGTR